jgi:hypothetical protein
VTESVDSDDDRAALSEEQLQAEEDAQFAAVSAATVGPLGDSKEKEQFAREQKLLDEMTEVAEGARGAPDARVRKLIDWIREHMCPDLPKAGKRTTASAAWNDTRILVFTEYDDTKRYLVQQLSAVIDGTDRAQEGLLPPTGVGGFWPPLAEDRVD